MTVYLSDDEVWAFLERALTGILTTVRSDGFPTALPVWYVVIDREIYLRTALSSPKVRRIRRDGRVGFLVESGERWEELKAVSVVAHAALVDDELMTRRVLDSRAEKYRGRGLGDDAPAATVRHYSRASAIVRLTPIGRPVSWDNGRIRHAGPSADGRPEIQEVNETKGK